MFDGHVMRCFFGLEGVLDDRCIGECWSAMFWALMEVISIFNLFVLVSTLWEFFVPSI